MSTSKAQEEVTATGLGLGLAFVIVLVLVGLVLASNIERTESGRVISVKVGLKSSIKLDNGTSLSLSNNVVPKIEQGKCYNFIVKGLLTRQYVAKAKEKTC